MLGFSPALIVQLQTSVQKTYGAVMKPVVSAQFVKVATSNDVAVRVSKGELGFKIFGATAAFGKHIAHIVFVGSKKEMGRINAKRVVASMTNMHCLVKGAICKLVGQAVGIVTSTPAPVGHKPAVGHSFAVQRTLGFALPNPAFAGLINLGPKFLFNSIVHSKTPCLIGVKQGSFTGGKSQLDSGGC